MWKWLFSKVIKMREKVAVDLGEKDVEKPFLDHLEDLRTMIVRMAITLCVTVLGTFYWAQDLIAILKMPLVWAGIDKKVSLIGLKVPDFFMTAVDVSMIAGIIIAFPLLLLFLLQFILPGLKGNEKKLIFPALGVGAGLFLIGVLFSYFMVLPGTLKFFYEFGVGFGGSGNPDDKAPPPIFIWNIVDYVKFVSQFILIFGACFELPVVVMALVKLDILSYKVMSGSRSYAIIAIAIAAAVITPTQDALTLALLAVPMYVLYEICIWLAWWMEKRDRKLHPEYYKGLDEDEKALEAEADWDNDSYNPWNDDKDDDADLKPTPAPTTSPTPAAETAPVEPEAVSETPVVANDKPVEKPAEKTLEDYAREAESHTGNPPEDKPHDDKPKQ